MHAGEIPSLDEVPVLAVAAAVAQGTTVFPDVGELRVKEVDRLVAVAAHGRGLRRPGHHRRGHLVVTGVGGPLRGARFDSRGDHRMAMAAAVAALAARPGERSLITGFGAVATSYPAFAEDLGAAGRPDRRRPGPCSSPSTARPAPASRRSPGRWPSGWASTGSTPAPCTGRSPRWPWSSGTPPDDHDAVAALAGASTIEVGERVSIDGRDVTGVIRSPEVGRAVSVVAANADVRRHLVERQRAWAGAHGGGVVEGRDIGSVVFPEAELKVYLTASPEERARRRNDEAPEGVARRDRIDSTREASPLREAADAHRLDTTGRTVEDVVEEVLSWL